jgi:hypothetical protein
MTSSRLILPEETVEPATWVRVAVRKRKGGWVVRHRSMLPSPQMVAPLHTAHS